MLDGFRKHSNSIIVKSLLFLLIASFAAWGIGDMLRPATTGNSVATVDGVEISAQEVYSDFQREMTRMRQLAGDQGINDTLSQAIGSSVVDRAVNRTLLAVHADDLDVAISDDLVAKEIRATEMFQEDGKFSRARFEQVMFSNQLNEAQYVELVRGDMARNQVVSTLLNGTSMPKDAAKDLYAHRLEKRSADIVNIAIDSFTNLPAPSEEEIRKYYEDNIDSFMAPEYRELTLLHITPADIAKTIDVSMEKMEDAFSERHAEFKKPARRTVEQIVFSSEADAKKAAEELASGKAFNELSGEVLALGDLTKEELPEELRDATFALSKGGVSAPVQSLLGWHIVHVTDAIEAVEPTLDDVKDQLRESIALELAGEELFSISNKIEDALGGGATIEDAAKLVGLSPMKIESTDDKGNSKDYKKIDALRGQQTILEDAFAQEIGADPSMKDDGQGGYFMVRVDSMTSSKARPFDDVKLAVQSFVEDIKKFDAAKKVAEDIVAKVKGGTSLADAANDAQLVLTSEKNFTRNDAQLPHDVVNALFDAKVGESASGATPSGHIVAVLSDIKSIDNADDQAGIENLRAELGGAISSDLQSQFINALRTRYSVDIDRAMVNRLFVTERQ